MKILDEEKRNAMFAIYAFCKKADSIADSHELKKKKIKKINELRKEINDLVTKEVGAIAKADKIQFVSGLPKTRSGKIMRRILRKIAAGESNNLNF